MSLSEKISEVQFPKAIAGYNTKEVDSFVSDILPYVREMEQTVNILQTKLGAFEEKQEELSQREQESYNLLEAAKKEAEIIVATARQQACDIVDDAKISAEAELRVAAVKAEEQLIKADKEAKARVNTANSNAEKIITVADAKGKAMLSDAKRAYDEVMRRAEALSGESASFETRFRTLVAETALALARLREESKLPKAEKKAETADAKPEPEPDPEPEIEPETTPIDDAPEAEVTSNYATDYEFAGGKPLNSSAERSERPQRRLYDTVSVTYENDDDFDDIKNIIRDGKNCKSPTHFSE